MITLIGYIVVGLVSYIGLLIIQGSFKERVTKKKGKRNV